MKFFFNQLCSDEENIILFKPFLENKNLSIMKQNFKNSNSIKILLLTRVTNNPLKSNQPHIYV